MDLVSVCRKLATSISEKLNSVVAGLGELAGAVAGSIISFVAGAIEWIATQFNSLVTWASEGLGTLVTWVTSGFESLVQFLQPVLSFLGEIAEAIFDVFKIPIVIAGRLWNMIPACIRDPFVKFLIEHIFKRIPILKQILEVPNIWEKIKAHSMRIMTADL